MKDKRVQIKFTWLLLAVFLVDALVCFILSLATQRDILDGGVGAMFVGFAVVFAITGVVLWFLSERMVARPLYESEALMEELRRDVRVRTEELERITLESANLANEKTQFFTAMSHEIRTHMNAINGISELMLLEKLTDKQRKHIKDVQVSATSLLGIVNDILDYSKIDAGELKLEPVHYNLHTMVTRVASIMELAAREKGLAFKVELSDDVPVCVYGDDRRLRQVFLNVLSNAIEYTEEGYVRFAFHANGDLLEIDVEDTGIGIEQKEIKGIFNPFDKLEEKINRGMQGTGLGLAITENVLSLMGGSIQVESKYGVGTTFHLSLPIEKGDAEQIAEDLTEFRFVNAPSAKVLLVDDIEANRYVGRGLLGLCGINCDMAKDGKEAVRMVREKDYDVVFMDYMMPEMNGVEAVSHIRKLGGKYESGKLIIIALTANVSPEAKDYFLSMGMDDFLSKPIDKVLLNQALVKWLPKEKQLENGNLASQIMEVKEEDYPPTLQRAATVEGLDVAFGLKHVSGVKDYERSLKFLAQRAPKEGEELTACLEGDLAEFAVRIHGMKGVLATNGHASLSEKARDLEMESKKGNYEYCKNTLPSFVRDLQTFGEKLSEAFADPDEGPKKEGSKEVLMESLDNMIGALSRYNSVKAMEEVKKISAYTFGNEMDGVLAQVGEAIEDFDYDQAMGMIATLRKGDMNG